MRFDASVRARVLDSLVRKRRVVMSNSFSSQGESARELQLSWIDNQIQKIKGRRQTDRS